MAVRDKPHSFFVQVTRDDPKLGVMLYAEFVCDDEGRANFQAGQCIDRLTDWTGHDYEYTVRPIAVLT